MLGGMLGNEEGEQSSGAGGGGGKSGLRERRKVRRIELPDYTCTGDPTSCPHCESAELTKADPKADLNRPWFIF